MRIEIIGVHPVNAPEPCYLIEARLEDIRPDFDLGRITQETVGQPRDNWQAPYDEHYLDPEQGTVLELKYQYQMPDSETIRVAFFFHYLNSEKPLLTPAGPVEIPSPSSLPSRLRFIKYDPP